MQDVKMAIDLLRQKHQCPHYYVASNYARVGTVQRTYFRRGSNGKNKTKCIFAKFGYHFRFGKYVPAEQSKCN